MAVDDFAATPAAVSSAIRDRETRKRRFRWHFFQVAFFLMYVGIVLDVLTTAMGFGRVGSAYEQNPVGGGLISHLGWTGLLALLTLLCIVCYLSFRVVYARMALRWSAILNTVVVIVLVMRWLTVAAAIVYLMQP